MKTGKSASASRREEETQEKRERRRSTLNMALTVNFLFFA